MGCICSKHRPEREVIRGRVAEPNPNLPQAEAPPVDVPAQEPSAGPQAQEANLAGSAMRTPEPHVQPAQHLFKLQAARAQQQAVLREELQQRLMREINRCELFKSFAHGL